MVRLSDLHPQEAASMLAAAPRFGDIDHEATPWIVPPPLAESTICLVTSAALHRRDDVPFRFGDSGYRLIPDDVDPNDLVQSQVSVNFDRTHYQRDMNVVLPIDRLHELHDAGEIGGVSPMHFSIHGASPDAKTFEASAADMANRMRELGVDAALLAPVWPACTSTVGVISHYLQRNGIPTTTISLIREHTEYARQPRALWVPFPLGRPFGVADDPEFQRDVLRSALRLLETATEPTIEDYPYDAPDAGGDGVWSCSIQLPEPEVSDLEAALRAEVDLLTPWYEEARRRRGRTTVGISGAKPEEIDKVVSFIVAIAEGSGFTEIPAAAEGPSWNHPFPMLVRFVVEDLRAFYQEAVSSQEGTKPPSQHDMHSWIFDKTALGQAIIEVGHQIAADDEQRLKMIRGLIVPEGFWTGDVSWGAAPPGMRRIDFIKSSRAYLAGEEA